jgi:hypothetical protein
MEAGGAMAEVGLLPFAHIALQVSRAVLPRYRSRFSKRQFTQPQLLAILCLMRYEVPSVKRKLSARAPGRSLRTQMRQALLLGSSFNLYRLKHRRPFPRMSTEPSHLINDSLGDRGFRICVRTTVLRKGTTSVAA